MPAPSVPPAPARLSITTGWCNASEIFWPTMRPRMSVVPPAAKGTISVIGLEGQASAACAAAPANRPAGASVATTARREREKAVIVVSFLGPLASVGAQLQAAGQAFFDGVLEQGGAAEDAVRKLAIGQREEQGHHDAEVHGKQRAHGSRVA